MNAAQRSPTSLTAPRGLRSPVDNSAAWVYTGAFPPRRQAWPAGPSARRRSSGRSSLSRAHLDRDCPPVGHARRPGRRACDDGRRHGPRQEGGLGRRHPHLRERRLQRVQHEEARDRPGILRPHRRREGLGVLLDDLPDARPGHRRGAVLRRGAEQARDHRRHRRVSERARLDGSPLPKRQGHRIRLRLPRDRLRCPLPTPRDRRGQAGCGQIVTHSTRTPPPASAMSRVRPWTWPIARRIGLSKASLGARPCAFRPRPRAEVRPVGDGRRGCS